MSHTSNLFILLLSCLVYFYFVSFASFIKTAKKLVTCFYFVISNSAKMSSAENTKLCDFASTNNNDFICSPIALHASPAALYEIKPALLNLVMKEQFSGVSSNDVVVHLNNFVELCEMQKYKDIDEDLIKLKLFPLSLRGRAKEWLLSLPKNSIDSWTKCKDAFIGKYYPPAKIISLRSSIMNFKQSDNEHVA